MRRRLAILVGFAVCAPGIALAQTQDAQMPTLTIDSGQQNAPVAESSQPPIATEPKPTRNFPSALVHNLGDDFKHMPRRNSFYWLAGGAVAALAVHPIDDNVHDHFLRTGGGNQAFWKAGRASVRRRRSLVQRWAPISSDGRNTWVVSSISAWTSSSPPCWRKGL